MRQTRLSLLLALIIAPAVACAADIKVDVELGWNGCYRVGRWTPVYITVSCNAPRNVAVRLTVPYDNMQAVVIHQTVPVNPQPQTFALYAPLTGSVDELSIDILDPNARMRRLAQWKIDPYDINPARATITAVNQLICISGQGNPRIIEGHFDARRASIRSVDPLRLPAVACGYEGLNALLLNQPDIARLTTEQQQALVDWVRAGGCAVLWASADQQPASGPLIDALPVTIGENVVLSVSSDALAAAGLPARYASLKARAVIARNAQEQAIPLLGGAATAYRTNLGLGQVTFLPIDPSQFVFHNPDHAREFWRPLLSPAVDLTPPAADSANPNYYPSYADPTAQRRAIASGQIMDRIGDIPGAGEFGFTYVIVIMIGLMLVVGPVDWFVLKWLGRQPWTWLTTTGWIALVTLGALYIGHAIRSGELHFNTLQIIDQADNLTVATADTVAIYAPRTAEYSLDTPREGFWQPLSAEGYYYRRGIKREVPFHQDYQASRPLPAQINVWNLRLLTGQTLAPAPPIVAAGGRIVVREGRSRLVGSLTNLSDIPLDQVIAQTAGGTCTLSTGPVPPAGSITFDAVVNPPIGNQQPEYVYGPYGAYPKSTIGIPSEYDLAADRSLAIERLISGGGHFCIYASGQGTASIARLSPAPDRQKHEVMVRAVLPLEAASR